MAILKPFYDAIAWLVVHIQSAVTHGAGKNWSWVLAIILLVIAMRVLLFPLFVKQIKTQRQMQVLQPKMKELQAKYKHDREKLNQEMMKLYKEHGANPLSGCLPLIVQMPVFFALFHTLNGFHPQKSCVQAAAKAGTAAFNACWHGFSGIDAHTVQQASLAKIFGTPIAAAFTSSHHTLRLLGATPTSVKVLTAVLIVVMGATTFFTQRQLLARANATGSGTPQASTQRTMLLVLPLFFTLFGFKFQLGVLLYWLTNNGWTMGQQFFVIRRMNPAPAATAATGGTTPPPRGPAPGQQPRRPVPPPVTPGDGARPSGDGARPSGDGGPPSGGRPAPIRPPGAQRSRRNRRRRR